MSLIETEETGYTKWLFNNWLEKFNNYISDGNNYFSLRYPANDYDCDIFSNIWDNYNLSLRNALMINLTPLKGKKNTMEKG